MQFKEGVVVRFGADGVGICRGVYKNGLVAHDELLILGFVKCSKRLRGLRGSGRVPRAPENPSFRIDLSAKTCPDATPFPQGASPRARIVRWWTDGAGVGSHASSPPWQDLSSPALGTPINAVMLAWAS